MREYFSEIIDAIALGIAVGLVMSILTRTDWEAYLWCGATGGIVLFVVDQINRSEPSTGMPD